MSKTYDNNYIRILVAFLTILNLFIGIKKSSEIVLLVGVFIWICAYLILFKREKLIFILMRIFVLSVPLSFVNIFGSQTELSTISWFNIFLVLLLIIMVIKIFKTKRFEMDFTTKLSVLVLIVAFVPTLFSNNFIDAIKQYIYIALTVFFVIFGYNLKDEVSKSQNRTLYYDYIWGTIIAATGVFLQIICYFLFDSVIGRFALYGKTRHAFGFIFSDYSFLSLYIVSGAILLFFSKYTKDTKLFCKYALIALLLISSILTSARTGIVAFIAVFGVYFINVLIKMFKKDKKSSIILLLFGIVSLLITYFILSNMRPLDLFNDSGRSKLNALALDKFFKSPLLGVGFGDNNYGGMLPHNIFYQSLAQGGLIYSVPLFSFFISIIYKAYKSDIGTFVTLACILIGSLFIPNIFDSRFLMVILFLISLDSGNHSIE